MGVDDANTILAWYNDCSGNQGHYREIWRLDVEISVTGEIQMELKAINKEV